MVTSAAWSWRLMTTVPTCVRAVPAPSLQGPRLGRTTPPVRSAARCRLSVLLGEVEGALPLHGQVGAIGGGDLPVRRRRPSKTHLTHVKNIAAETGFHTIADEKGTSSGVHPHADLPKGQARGWTVRCRSGRPRCPTSKPGCRTWFSPCFGRGPGQEAACPGRLCLRAGQSGVAVGQPSSSLSGVRRLRWRRSARGPPRRTEGRGAGWRGPPSGVAAFAACLVRSVGGEGVGEGCVDGGAAEDAEHGVVPPVVQAEGDGQGDRSRTPGSPGSRVVRSAGALARCASARRPAAPGVRSQAVRGGA